RMPTRQHLAKMVRADLVVAGIPYRDDDGRVADFHSFRHTFISNLARGGVHPKVAQQLARHSTITLTMDRYSHTLVEEQSAALAALPDLGPTARHAFGAVGTDGATSSPRRLGVLLGASGATSMSPVDSDRLSGKSEAEKVQDKKTPENVAQTAV